MQEQSQATPDYISLTEVAKIAPGRPSTNCVWRWCRRGVRGRDGERVRLQHVRIGGMIYTTRHWLDEFGRRLAEADARYFELCDAAANVQRAGQRRRPRPPTQFEQDHRTAIDETEVELAKAGI
ncbi:MAG TPA: hypothetical protein VJZ71_16645 [Phycisphaerae bacterium]|nr:hypothetical protein [Phycisphaerae bacterium]